MSGGPITVSVDEFMSLIEHHVGTLVVLVTPEIATVAKKRTNHGNRVEKWKNTARLAEDMKAGRWINSGEPVVFARTGVLNDGQHRLQAIIDSGVSVMMDVTFGAPREVFTIMGGGKRRTTSQVLTSVGEVYAPVQAAIAKLIILHNDGRLAATRPSVQTPQIVQVIRADRNILAVARALRGTKRLAPMLTAGFGFPLVLAARVAPFEQVSQFIDLVSSGLSADPQRCPARALHQRLVDSMSERRRLTTMEIANITGRSWNAWITGREIKLRVLATDHTGKDFPTIVGAPVA